MFFRMCSLGSATATSFPWARSIFAVPEVPPDAAFGCERAPAASLDAAPESVGSPTSSLRVHLMAVPCWTSA